MSVLINLVIILKYQLDEKSREKPKLISGKASDKNSSQAAIQELLLAKLLAKQIVII